jgi:hypothetical protein
VGLTTRLTPALVVPDEQSWTVLGTDPAELGAEPAFEARVVERLLVPDPVPEALAGPLHRWLAMLPSSVTTEAVTLTLPETKQVHALTKDEQHASHIDPERYGGVAHDRMVDAATGYAGTEVHAGHDMHGGQDMHEHPGHGGHAGHHDMMAIVGEPSADGLVMERITLRIGPLGTALPGGLAVEVTLDGDVVAESSIQALLRTRAGSDGAPPPPDQLSPVAWSVAIAAAAESAAAVSVIDAQRWVRLAAVELERALSHLAWLRALARLVSWPLLVEQSTAALAGILRARRLLPFELDATDPPDARAAVAARHAVEAAREPVATLAELSRRSRRLRLRTSERSQLTAGQVRDAGLRGPAARASGLADDARSDDPLYRQLGFEPVVRAGGDALARAQVRCDEAVQALRLGAAALHAAEDGGPAQAVPRPAAGTTVEGPRGPLRAERLAGGWGLSAPGAPEARASAAEAMVGLEWASALVAVTSFDLSPWQVDA